MRLLTILVRSRIVLHRKVLDMYTKKKSLRDIGSAFVFLGPSLFAFTCVLMIPMFYGVFLTFTDYHPIHGMHNFVGLDNFRTAFTDQVFFRQMGVTLRYVVISTILVNVVAFSLAYVLTTKLRLRNIVRTGFFTPNLIGGIILGYIWRFIFANVLTPIGRNFDIAMLSTSFLTHPDRALNAMIIVTIWQYAGYLMVIYIAGFISIPKDIQEAAALDRASGLRKVFFITIPLMVPSFIICFFITVSRTFMTYDLNLALTGGDPFGTTRLVPMHIFQVAFQQNRYGVGQAQAIMLFVVVAVIAVTQVLIAKRYEVES